MAIKYRIIIPMIVTAILVASAILASNIAMYSSHVDAEMEKNLDEAVLEMLNEVDMLKSGSMIAALYFANDVLLAGAVERADRAALSGRISQLCAVTGIELCAVVDAGGAVLSIYNFPDKFGDDLSGLPCIREALNGEVVSGVERGVAVSISINTGTPVYDARGGLIGAVMTGFRFDTDNFVDKLKKISGCEHTVFVDRVRVATTMRGADGNRAVGTESAAAGGGGSGGAGGGGDVGDNGKAEVYVYDSTHKMLVKHIALADADGRRIGELYAGQYLSQKTETVSAFIFYGVVITVFLLGVCILLILYISRRISDPIVDMLDNINIDGLTGIYNRRYFNENIVRLISAISRSGGLLSLLMVDIDFFKRYNDTYGHGEGDACLKKVADCLSGGVTRADDFVARYGGEEFVVVLPNTDETGACKIAERLLVNVRNCAIPHIGNDAAGYVTVSIGVTTGRVDHMQTGEEYVARADEMLYRSKQGGRDRYNYAKL